MNAFEKLLSQVHKPQRYVGGEVNACLGPRQDNDLHVLVAYPDLYEVGMSNMALRIFYYMLNSMEGVRAERGFMPGPDMADLLRAEGLPLTSLETVTPLADFDLLGFTLQYELTYTNVLEMLDLAGIPVREAGRGDGHPLVIVGGPCATNPEPIRPFVDLICIGDGEPVMEELARRLRKVKGAGRSERLDACRGIPGLWVQGDALKVTRSVVSNLDDVFHPEKTIVPFMPAVHDRISIEIARGCPHGCRFCHAGFTYRPYRERSVERIVEIAERQVESTGYQEITLASLSATDHSQIRELVETLQTRLGKRGVSVALPSLRISDFSVELARAVGMVRRGGLTLAPEAGSEALRRRINKNVTAEDLTKSVEAAARSGWRRVKLYFMAGLPGETDLDIEAMADLALDALAAGRRHQRGGFQVTASVSSFVPKPHTPFQRVARIGRTVYLDRMARLRDAVRGRKIQVKFSDTFSGDLETVFSRGDASTAELLYTAWREGARLDGWDEYLNREAWDRAFAATGFDQNASFSAISDDAVLPWSWIDVGVNPEFLEGEARRSEAGQTTVPCDTEKCRRCGACPV